MSANTGIEPAISGHHLPGALPMSYMPYGGTLVSVHTRRITNAERAGRVFRTRAIERACRRKKAGIKVPNE